MHSYSSQKHSQQDKHPLKMQHHIAYYIYAANDRIDAAHFKKKDRPTTGYKGWTTNHTTNLLPNLFSPWLKCPL